MIRRVLFVLVMFSGSGVGAQAPTFAYSDAQLRWNEVECHVDRGLVRRGHDWRGEVIYSVRGELIFNGFSGNSFDLFYALRDGKLCLGDSNFTDAISYSIFENRIYVGDSSFPMDLAYTIRVDRMNQGVLCVYKGDSISPFDVVAYFQGEPTHTEIFALLLTMELL